MSAGEFFDLVDELVVPPMAALGYHRIGGHENDEPASRTILASSDGDGSVATGFGGVAPFLSLDFGFEAATDEAARRVNPNDPATADEMWLSWPEGCSTSARGATSWWATRIGLRTEPTRPCRRPRCDVALRCCAGPSRRSSNDPRRP